MDPKRALRHVLWIGGPPDCGKTTIADLLAARHDLDVYHFDRCERDHIRRADPVLHPALYRFGRQLAELDDRSFLEWAWVHPTPREMAEHTIACWSERVALAVEDLLARPKDRLIIAEGPGFFPAAVLPLITTPHHAIWLVPTEDFQRASHMRRRKGAYRDAILADPQHAHRQHIARDLLLAEHYRASARALGVPIIEVDGSQPPEDVATRVERHVAPLLSARPGKRQP